MNSSSKMDTHNVGQNKSGGNVSSPRRAALIFAASVFVVELTIMFIFFIFPPLPPLIEAFTDSTALIILIFPVLYFFSIKPSVQAIAERNRIIEENLALNRTLSDRVAERTRELELANDKNSHRAEQFEAIASVARTIGSTQEMDMLLPLITRVIGDHFGFYHVAIYLNDAFREFSVLVAANSEAGRRMISRENRLRIGEEGVIGYVIAASLPRLITRDGTDAAYFNIPELPEAQSEVVLPLRIGDNCFGALDVQSTDINAFTQEDVFILSTLADQVTVAIENARLFEETRQALTQAESIYQRYVGQSWQQYSGHKHLAGFEFDGKEIRVLDQAEVPNNSDPGHGGENEIAIPLTVGGQPIGSLNIRPQEANRRFTKEEHDLLAGIAERAALALENARLLEDSQKRAAKELTISQASTRISASLDFDQILRATAKELEKSLGSSEIVINLENRE